MRIEVLDGKKGWPLVESLDGEVYPPEVMATVPWRNITWAHADKRVVVWDETRIRCHVGVFWRIGTLNGNPTQMAGIGGVMTSVAVRRKGYASGAMSRAAQLMGEQTVDFGLLFCEPHNEQFYRNLGWRVFEGEVWFEQSQGKIRFDLMHAMILPIRAVPDGGVIDLCGLPW